MAGLALSHKPLCKLIAMCGWYTRVCGRRGWYDVRARSQERPGIVEVRHRQPDHVFAALRRWADLLWRGRWLCLLPGCWHRRSDLEISGQRASRIVGGDPGRRGLYRLDGSPGIRAASLTIVDCRL